MPRWPRKVLPDGVFHVTARGVDGCAIFHDDVDRVVFLRLLGEVVAEHGWRCYAYCLMTTHYHLIVEAPRTELSTGLHRLNGIHAQRFNKRHGRTGHLFGDRFAAYVIATEDHLEAAVLYVLANPVRAGLCAVPDAWPWSHAEAA